jgi:hypothetical protein
VERLPLHLHEPPPDNGAALPEPAVLLEPVEHTAPGKPVQEVLLRGAQMHLEFPPKKAREKLFIDALSSDDGVVEIIDEGSNSGREAIVPGWRPHGRCTIEKKLTVVDGCATIRVKRTVKDAAEKLQ